MEAPDLTEEVSVVDTAPVYVGTYSYILKGEYCGSAVAVKVLRPLSVPMHAMNRKIRRELKVWAQMDHPNIAPLLGYTSGSKIFGVLGSFISPWYPNGDAATFLALRGKDMNMDERKKLWQEIVAGVCYLHNNSPVIIHGDLKPKNVLIDNQGIAKICDFGLVRIFLEEGHSGHTTTSEYTGGTDRYLAYELVTSPDVSQLSTASDVYAMGCIGLECLFLQAPHCSRRSNRYGEIFQDVRNGMPPASRPSSLPSHDAYLWNLLESCWVWLPDGRAAARDIYTSLSNSWSRELLQEPVSGGPTQASVGDVVKNVIDPASYASASVLGEQLKHSTGGQPVYEGMPPLTSYFVMRKEPWEKMTRRLINGDAEQEEQKIMVISGMEGCGKTQLVVRFTKEFKSRFKFVFFIDGSSRESIQADIINRVRKANPAYPQATFAEAISFFCNPYNSPWMAIYHNVDDDSINLSSLIPECSFGTILITTKTQARGRQASPSDLHIQLEVMSLEEAIETILLAANMERTDDAVKSVRSVAKELGNLPVALVQAGSYMRQSKCSCEEYLDKLHQSGTELMYKPAGDRLQRSAYHAFDLSFQQVQPFVQNFLHIIGSLHHANFPMKAIAIAAQAEFSFDQFSLIRHDANFEECVEILKSIFFPDGTWDECVLDNIVTELNNYSLANFTYTPGSLLLQMHPLIHQWTLVHLTPEKQACYRLTASRLLACSCNEDTLQELLIPHVDALIPQLPDSPKAIYDNATFGLVLRKMGRNKDSKAIWEPIYNAIVQHYGKQDLHVATVALELAAATTGDWEKVEMLEKQALGIRESVLGLEHIETLYAKKELSGTYQLQGRLRDAELLCLEVLESMKKTLDFTDNEVIRLMQFLGQLYRSQGSYSEAESLHEDILKTRRERLGDTHIDTLMAMHELAMTYNSQGRHSDAELLQQHVLKTQKERLGDTHVDTLWAMDNLAWTYDSQSRHSEAEALAENVLKVQSERLGDTHVDTLQAMYTLALAYHSQGRHSDAEPLQRHVLKIRRERLGDTHVDTLRAMDNLAWTYDLQGRHSEAEALAEHVLKIQNERLGDTHVDTLRAMHNLALTYDSQRRHSNAEPLQQHVLKIRKAQLGDNHIDTLQAMNNLALTYHSQGSHSDAESLQQHVLKTRQMRLGDTHVDTLEAMHNLALTYDSQRRHSDAEPLLRYVLKMRKERLGDTHIDTHSTMHELALNYFSQGRYSIARPLQEKVLEGRRKLHGEHSLKTAISMNSLGWTYYHLNMFAQANELATQAKQVQKDILGVNHPYYKNTADLFMTTVKRAVIGP